MSEVIPQKVSLSAMPKEPPINPLVLYCALMEEVKLRLNVLNDACSDRVRLPTSRLLREFCFLQLRMTFELIAVACLAAHSHHINVKRLEKEWSANEIMPRLEKLNPNFFPKAVVITDYGDRYDAIDVNPPPMTKSSFLGAYGRCGANLHRGDMKRIMSAIPEPEATLDDVRGIVASIVALLNSHRIASADLKLHYFCNMVNGPEGRVAIITSVA